MRRRLLTLSGAAVVGVLAAATAVILTLSTGTGDARSRVPSAHTFSGLPQVGALFKNAQTASHGCTASVIHSHAGDTLITAAHCITGTGKGMVFVPGLHGTVAPYGRWTVTSAYVSRHWTTSRDPHADLAVMTVAPRVIAGVSREIESVVGAERLGPTARLGERVTVPGYPAGSTDDPITCTVRVYLTDGYPSFDCQDYVGGTSGSPWLADTPSGVRVVGIIGGLNQGGCYQYTSYSAPLSRRARHILHRASAGRPGDTVPVAGSDGC